MNTLTNLDDIRFSKSSILSLQRLGIFGLDLCVISCLALLIYLWSQCGLAVKIIFFPSMIVFVVWLSLIDWWTGYDMPRKNIEYFVGLMIGYVMILFGIFEWSFQSSNPHTFFYVIPSIPLRISELGGVMFLFGTIERIVIRIGLGLSYEK